MRRTDIRGILIPEETYAVSMRETVEPYLQERQEIRTLYREKNHPINCVRYTPEDPEGVIVVSHGFTESTVKYKEMIYYFLQAGCVVYALDHCEHGKSYRLTDELSKVHCDSYRRWVDDLLFVAHFTGKAYPDLPLYLYGHSMGGGIGAAVIASEPDLFTKAVLTSPMIRPATAGVPWPLTRLLCGLFCAIGKAEDYAPGNHPYDRNEPFEESASMSKARYDYYMEKRSSDPLYQMSGATWGWLRCAVQMNTWLMKTGWKQVKCPVLLFQAEQETFVINAQEDLFIKKIGAGCDARLVPMADTKHEIFNSHDEVIAEYLEEILTFLND